MVVLLEPVSLKTSKDLLSWMTHNQVQSHGRRPKTCELLELLSYLLHDSTNLYLSLCLVHLYLNIIAADPGAIIGLVLLKIKGSNRGTFSA